MACSLCDVGHRKVGPMHMPSQSKGMIPPTLCKDEVAHGVPLYAAWHGSARIYHGWDEREAQKAAVHHVDNCAHKDDEVVVKECFCEPCVARLFPVGNLEADA
jgi:hypothetical protein